jgi:hypothetical protein
MEAWSVGQKEHETQEIMRRRKKRKNKKEKWIPLVIFDVHEPNKKIGWSHPSSTKQKFESSRPCPVLEIRDGIIPPYLDFQPNAT